MLFLFNMIARQSRNKPVAHDNSGRKPVAPNCPPYRNYKADKMREKSEPRNHYYTTIATKVSKADKAKLVSIADGFGMTFYELLQALLLAMVRYFDTGSLVTYEHNAMINAFANTMFVLKDSYSPLSIRGHEKRVISRAFLLVEQRPRKQPQLLEVSKDHCGNLIESYNFDTMLSDFMGALDPEALQALTREQQKQGYFSIAHTLHEIVMQHTDPPADMMSNEISEMFTDARTGTGEKVNENIYYRQKHNIEKEYTAPTPRKKRLKVEL